MKRSLPFSSSLFSLWHDVFAEAWIKAMLSPKTPMRATARMQEPCYSLPLLWSWILFWEGLCVIIPRGQAPALGCDPSLQTEASIPIIKSDLPGRHVEWISLCTAEASITVIPLQSASTLKGRWKKSRREGALFTACVTAEGMRREVGGISGLSRQLLPQPRKRTKD